MGDSLTFVFPAKTVDYIANVLAQRPWAEVNAILADMQQQAQKQQQPAQAFSGPPEAVNGSGAGADTPVQ